MAEESEEIPVSGWCSSWSVFKPQSDIFLGCDWMIVLIHRLLETIKASIVAEDVSSRVLTLPTYYGLALDDVRAIAKNVMELV